MLKRKQMAILNLNLLLMGGLCLPALAQDSPSPRPARYGHLENLDEEAPLGAGPTETTERTLNFLQTYEPEVCLGFAQLPTSDAKVAI